MVQAAKSSSTVTGYSCSVHGQTNKHEKTKREKKCSVRWLAFSICCFNMSTRAFETLGRVSEDGHLVRFGSRFAKFVQEAVLLLARSCVLAVSGVAMPFDSFTRPGCQSCPSVGVSQRGMLGILKFNLKTISCTIL
ncbi:Hypothetical protein NCS54_01135100 [Fusarium falciforme]|uniref:Hypothetical protein n=1 Tax=Fusarium falciforme TaxID=195108 RepID=UPI0022FFE220|nr:Hypothetical protein NCS54_01135100 [Fusarium falciforme]WAO93796.1 Hypothetical protein NCS54_01135100 [Fusarium falciforme]